MTDLTQGYRGEDRGNTRILDAILKDADLAREMLAPELAHQLFTGSFMPYAKRHWIYHASRCNCQDLASAFVATWEYSKFLRRKMGLPAEREKAKTVTCIVGEKKFGVITRAEHVFGGPARGNVRVGRGRLDGRCLFAGHWMCQIANRYFDPTFDRETFVRDDIVERRLRKFGEYWLALDDQFVYERSEEVAAGFSDSWLERRIRKISPVHWLSHDHRFLYQLDADAPTLADRWKVMDANDWVTYHEWTSLTSRWGHGRSGDLNDVDQALKTGGKSNRTAVHKAFRNWFRKNPREVAKRNKEGIIIRLAHNVGLAEEVLNNRR